MSARRRKPREQHGCRRKSQLWTSESNRRFPELGLETRAHMNPPWGKTQNQEFSLRKQKSKCVCFLVFLVQDWEKYVSFSRLYWTMTTFLGFKNVYFSTWNRTMVQIHPWPALWFLLLLSVAELNLLAAASEPKPQLQWFQQPNPVCHTHHSGHHRQITTTLYPRGVANAYSPAPPVKAPVYHLALWTRVRFWCLRQTETPYHHESPEPTHCPVQVLELASHLKLLPLHPQPLTHTVCHHFMFLFLSSVRVPLSYWILWSSCCWGEPKWKERKNCVHLNGKLTQRKCIGNCLLIVESLKAEKLATYLDLKTLKKL